MADLTYFERLMHNPGLRAKALAGEVIPSWQVGQEQPNPQDVKNFVEEGYAKNSLIFACIREKATALAPLRVRLLRSGPDDSLNEVKGHAMIRLLDNPNTFQSRAEFHELLSTHLDTAGNAYVYKIRRSPDPERRRQFSGPVQELQLLRPDYVTVKAGAVRADDMFLVTVEGQVRAQIPRRDIIHIKTPHPTNDFYGLSPIALLVREGNIDLSMSDFEYAFFQNAGIPAGILSVKGAFTREQGEEVKSRFKDAYNGVKRWFSLFVVNADVAKYDQLGLPQSQMEMDGTRFHVETRICAVFGVPPRLVNARAAMFATTGLNTQADAQFAFWSETMMPLGERIAAAYRSGLLPEFGTVEDKDAEVSFDYSVVRALQEDRSLKLREVVRMTLTGVFTKNEALELVGLPGVPGGDFFLRNLNQIEVKRDANGDLVYAEPPPTPVRQTKNPDNPLEGSARLGDGLSETDIQRLFPRLPQITGQSRGAQTALATTTIPVKAAQNKVTKTVERDEEGRIVRVIEETSPS
jgi:HK97 family phage portal protein